MGKEEGKTVCMIGMLKEGVRGVREGWEECQGKEGRMGKGCVLKVRSDVR